MVILTSFPPPTEGIRHKQENTAAHIDGKAMGNGTLFVAESRVSWMGTDGQGFSLEYPAVSLHAVSRDTSTFPHECLYLMVDAKLSGFSQGDAGEGTSNGSNEDDEEDESPIGEIRFVPTDKGTLDAMFLAMNECQSLHPDPQDSDSEADADEEFYTGEEGEGQLSEEGLMNLARFENVLQVGQGDGTEPETNGNHVGVPADPGQEADMEMGQFEDADMEQ